MKKARFVFWWEADGVDSQPFFNAPDGSTVSGETLLERYRLPLPLFPAFETWKREVQAKRRCHYCWAVTRCAGDAFHHFEKNHKPVAA